MLVLQLATWRFYWVAKKMWIVEVRVEGVSVGDISEWWLRGCGEATGRLVVVIWVQKGLWIIMFCRRNWAREEGTATLRQHVLQGWVLGEGYECLTSLVVLLVNHNVWNFCLGFLLKTKGPLGYYWVITHINGEQWRRDYIYIHKKNFHMFFKSFQSIGP